MLRLTNIIFCVVGCVILYSCTNITAEKGKIKSEITMGQSFTDWVNPFIGTGGHGHTFPGATVPNGMVQLSPDTRLNGWDACSGYHISDNAILGFSHTHLSGTGIGDYGDVLFMPTSGKQASRQGTAENPDNGYASRKKADSEKASPGAYSVVLEDYNIKVELTATLRAGFHRYTYEDDEAGLIIDLNHTLQSHKNVKADIEIVNNNEIRGVKYTEGWAREHRVYFHAVFSKPFTFKDLKKKGLAKIKFDESTKELLVKVGISSVDYQGAKNNLDSEIPDWDFNRVQFNANRKWEDHLSKIEVEGGSDDQKTIFYTALYHAGMAPYTFSDADGRYLGMDKEIRQSNQTNYTVFSLWDTFRALHPLNTIVSPAINQKMISSLLSKYDEGGVLPKWELAANYTGTMIGYHAVPVIVDAFMKGQRNFDIEKAYEAIVHASTYDTVNVEFFDAGIQKRLMAKGKFYNEELGYLPADLENESVSKALEYAYNDWCIAQMAKELGKKEDYERFMERSKRYAQYFDKKTGFMRGKLSKGGWREPFNPKYSNHRKDDYVEGNAWQWTWFVPHDVKGLVDLYGSEEDFVSKLDQLFSENSEVDGKNSSSDISGLIGQYAHGNEPSHHIAYLYNYVGQPEKSQKIVSQILDSLYFNNPNGLSGNEDCGQMSAWYILSAMGIYQVAPGDPTYALGSPIFDRIKINLENGNDFQIITENNGSLVKGYLLNGNQHSIPFITHEQIEAGGILKVEKSRTP
ncbi:MAG: GH92 family glycosyl hydrolase [Reichenbachiella sp.]